MPTTSPGVEVEIGGRSALFISGGEMGQVAVVTDSTASLPAEMYARYQMVVVPYYLHLPGRVARDGLDITTQELCVYLSGLPDRAELPRTANPGPGEFLEAYLAAAQRSREIISIHITSKGSGSYQAATIGREMALQQLRGVHIEVVDTLNVSMCHGWMVLQAARAAAEGAALPDLLDLVRRMIPVTRMIQTADTLRYLYMGGRIGRAGHLVGSMLNIKPLISMQDGVIVTLGVARTRMGAYQRMASLVQKAVGRGGRVRLALTHAGAQQDAEALRLLVSKGVTPVETLFCELSPALAVHSGPGTVGLCYCPEGV